MALRNAQLYESERNIADRLQEALLSVPESIGGIEFGHAYHSATEAARVGGDFFDIFDLDSNHVGITIGDVAGKGLDAAVLTSLVKNAIRAHAAEAGKTPRQILGLTNDLVYRSTPTEAFVTVFLAILDCRDGRLTYSNAGHTTAVVLRRSGVISKLSATGPLLGAFAASAFDQAETRLEPDELLFLYTDGLTEARREGQLYGEDRLFTFLLSKGTAPSSDVVQTVIDEVMSFSGKRLRDDLALLAVRRVEPEADSPVRGPETPQD
jgi:serine phosphatase RsbU (regulator of sigma subunit)